MTYPIVLLDSDGVLGNFIGATLRRLSMWKKHIFTHDDITKYEIVNCLNLDAPNQHRLKAEWSKPGFCYSIEPYSEALQIVPELQRISEVYVVTAPMSSCPTWTSEREAWLSDHFGIKRSHVLHGAAKHLVHGDIFADDKISNVIGWQENNPGWAVLIDQPYNRHENNRNVVRGNLTKVLEMAKEIR